MSSYKQLNQTLLLLQQEHQHHKKKLEDLTLSLNPLPNLLLGLKEYKLKEEANPDFKLDAFNKIIGKTPEFKPKLAVKGFSFPFKKANSNLTKDNIRRLELLRRANDIEALTPAGMQEYIKLLEIMYPTTTSWDDPIDGKQPYT